MSSHCLSKRPPVFSGAAILQIQCTYQNKYRILQKVRFLYTMASDKPFENAHSEYCITAGEFAQMCQTTRDTLRYYEKQGILVPYKNEENGYHYYSYSQLSSYYFIKTFRSLDCSAADIRTYLLGGEEIRFDEFVDQQYDSLLQMKLQLDQKLSMITNTRKILKQIRINDIGHPVLYTFPEDIVLKQTPVLSVPAVSSGEIAADIHRHLEACQLAGTEPFPMGASIAVSDFLRADYTYKNVFSFAQIGKSSLKVPEDPSLFPLPSRNAIVSVCTENDGDIRKTYADIATLLTRQRKHLCSDIYSLSIVNVLNPHAGRKYLKYIFACVD